ncbi:hypothetical protein [Falsiroseomonas ponticola]|uniref:hypothetical protein n=1 Tax=Falsiroseomonas ponticola TaxID=2786951 RepID=UPI001931F3C7|nr:hypothetical protein [Roseomonas ponticola]
MIRWSRLRGLVLSPRREWAAIAAAESPSLSRSLALMVLPWLLVLAYGAMLGGPLLPVLEQSPVFMQRPDGSQVQIGVMTRGRTGGLLTSLGGIAGTLAWVALQRAMILRSATRHLAAPDGVAALKLTLHAFVPVWIALVLVPLTPLLFLPAAIHAVVLTYLGAPMLLPPHQGQEKRFGRSVAFGTVLFGLVTIGGAVAAALGLASVVLG